MFFRFLGIFVDGQAGIRYNNSRRHAVTPETRGTTFLRSLSLVQRTGWPDLNRRLDRRQERQVGDKKEYQATRTMRGVRAGKLGNCGQMVMVIGSSLGKRTCGADFAHNQMNVTPEGHTASPALLLHPPSVLSAGP